MTISFYLSCAIVAGPLLLIAYLCGYPHRFWCPARPNAKPNGEIVVSLLGPVQVACCVRCNSARVRSSHIYLRPNDLLELDALKRDDVVFVELDIPWVL